MITLLSALLFLNIIHENHAQETPRYPIVYCEEYNIGWGGPVGWALRKLHPFDGTKYRRIAQHIATALNVDPATHWYRPQRPVTTEEKLLVHTPEYLASLNKSSVISEAIDCGQLLSLVPNATLQKLVLKPMEWATSGTILAIQLALEKGWSINLGGGYHHAAPNHGEGGCIFSDVPMALHVLWQKQPDIKVLIIDLDAHQGNGFEKAISNDARVVYFDVFNPNAGLADEAIIRTSRNIIAEPLNGGHLSSVIWGINFPDILAERCVDRKVSDDEYMQCMKTGLQKAFAKAQEYFGKQPDLIVYNAGSDSNSNDPWGCMDVSEQAIIDRDYYIFSEAISHNIPICMVLSGSYFPRSAEVISQSIVQIIKDTCTSSFLLDFIKQGKNVHRSVFAS
jgi:histone deacetylase 11